MQVFVVTSGEYSDFSLDSIHSTRDKAEAYIRAYEGAVDSKDFNRIETWEVDNVPDEVARPFYEAVINIETGEVRFVEEDITRLAMGSPNDRVRRTSMDYTPRYIEVESFVSLEHAAKVAIERRQAYLRDPRTRLYFSRGQEELPEWSA